jgi:hypothetical protein
MATETLSVLPRGFSEPRRPRWKMVVAGAPMRSAATAMLAPAAVLLVVDGALHLHLWSSGYRGIPTIGPLFLAQGIATLVIAVVLLLTRWLVAVVAALATMVGTVGGFVLADTVGLFGFYDGFAAPDASISFVIEVTAIVLLLIGGALLARGWLLSKTSPSPRHQAWAVFDEVPRRGAGDDRDVNAEVAPSSGLPPRR